ncbi:MAG: glycosyl transferase family 2 [Candidatus Levybacteria bacterium CG10_big_fil_rev_8_21_14_0_10_35_13]|nr:MAG: glycosyl transferase family 2 [Candidatus Levybacteria bacterium CG10_big_fil_rev_8_21_14_0_10_35_13]
MTTDLSIVILNYNSKNFTLQCISSIKKFSKEKLENGQYEILVVDNLSNDGSKEFFKKIEGVTFIYNSKNLGFSKGNNSAVSKTKGRYILFLNPDTVVYKDTLSVMVDFMDTHKKAGAATCKLLMGSGKIDDAIHRGFPTPWNSLMYFSGISKIFPKSKIFNGYQMGWLDMEKTHEVDVLAGAFMIVRRKAGEEIGWWDEDYFFYGEDIEFCYMLKAKGWKIYYVVETSAFHHKGVTGGIRKESKEITTADKKTKILVTNWRFNAMNIFYNKHYKNKYPFFVEWITKTAVELKRRKSLREIQ